MCGCKCVCVYLLLMQCCFACREIVKHIHPYLSRQTATCFLFHCFNCIWLFKQWPGHSRVRWVRQGLVIKTNGENMKFDSAWYCSTCHKRRQHVYKRLGEWVRERERESASTYIDNPGIFPELSNLEGHTSNCNGMPSPETSRWNKIGTAQYYLTPSHKHFVGFPLTAPTCQHETNRAPQVQIPPNAGFHLRCSDTIYA